MLDEIEGLEKDYENWNHVIVANKVENIIDSGLFQKLPLKQQLLLKYYHIFPLELWGVHWSPDNVQEILNHFESINFEKIADPLVQLFYNSIKIKILDYRLQNIEAENLVSSCEILIKNIVSDFKLDNEVKKILGLFYFVSSTIFMYNKDKKEDTFQNIKTCQEYWMKIDNQYYIYLSWMIEQRYKVIYDDDNIFDFLYLLIDFLEKNNFSPIYKVETYFLLIANYLFSEHHDLKKAMYYNDKGIELIENYISDTEIEFILYLKARMYTQKAIITGFMGDINSSIYFEKETLKISNSIFEKYGRYLMKGTTRGNLGELYLQLGKVDLALDFQLEAYEIRLRSYKNAVGFRLKQNATAQLVENCYELIKLYLLIGREVEALNYLKKINELMDEKINFKFEADKLAINKLSQALILQNKGNFKDKSKAKDLFYEAVQLPTKFEILLDSLIFLINMVIQEYNIFKNNESLEEFTNLSDIINEIAEKNNSYWLKVNLLMLNGKIAVIKGDYKEAEEKFLVAKALAKDYLVVDLEEKINKELEVLHGDTLQHSSIKERFVTMEIEKYIKDAFNIIKE